MMSLPRIFGLMLLFLVFEASVAVAAILWWKDANPLLVCAAMTALALGVWLCIFLVTRLLARQRATPGVDVQRPAPLKKPAAEDAFTQEMNALIFEANRRLEGLMPQDGRRQPITIASLPLYLVIGPEGSGKTTAMMNSGLEPRLLAGEAVRDGNTLPTRLANLWLADGCIFAEICGRVLMQDPDHWEQALRLLSEQRRLPQWKRILFGSGQGPNLRGVVMACDTQSFLRQSDLQRLPALARLLNERLGTAESVYGKQFPVYALLTHCDGVQYFPDFFAHLSESEARRPLGSTLDILKAATESADAYSDREGRRLTGLFNRLYQSIADKRMVLLARDEDPGKRALAYEFPRELKKLRGDVVQFLLDVFRPADLQPAFHLRGFYFSGRRMIARARADMEMSFTANSVVRRPAEATVFFESKQPSSAPDASVFARRAGAGSAVAKWAFLTEVFRDIILKDPAGEVAPNVRTKEHTLRNLGFAAAGALCLLLSVIWATSWQKNHGLLVQVQAAVNGTRPLAAASGPESLMELESMRPLLVTLHGYARDGAPYSYRWGLYSGDSAKTTLNRLYFQRFRLSLLNPVLLLMTEHFMALQPNTPAGEDVTALLKSYRTITSRSCTPDEAVLKATVFPLWRASVSPDAEMADVAERQVGFYISEVKIVDPYTALGTPISENREAVARAQNYLQDLGGPDKILRALITQVNGKQAAERLNDYAGDYVQVMSGPNELEGAYTAHGWTAVQDSLHTHKLVAAGEPCVTGSVSGVTSWAGDANTEASVDRMYSDGYVRQWKDFLASHHVLPFNSAPDASAKLRMLADNNRSPMLALVYMVSANTKVSEPHSVSDRMSDSIRSAANDTKTTLQKAWNKLGSSGAGSDSPSGAASTPTQVNTVMTEFAPVHAMVDPDVRDKWLNEKNQAYMKSLEELSTAIGALPPQVNTGSPDEMQELQQASAAVNNAYLALHTLEGTFPNTPLLIDVDLKNLLQEPISYADKTVRAVVKVKAPPALVAGAAVPPPAAAGPSAHELAIPTIKAINHASLDLCSAVASEQGKYPFDATSTQDASLDELDGIFGSGNGALGRFSGLPDVSKAYTRQGKTWTAKPDFPATFSLPFTNELNSLSGVAEAFYADGSSHPHIEYTLTLDGTGKIPYELDVDGHVIKYIPGKPGIPTRLVWPPVTNGPTRLVMKSSVKGDTGHQLQNTGIWGLHHLLQSADEQSGNVFTFGVVEFAHSVVPMMTGKGTPGTLQIRVESSAGNIFARGYFSRLRCENSWAVN